MTATYDCYLLDAPKLLAEIAEAIWFRDAVALFKAAHRLRLSSANFSALHLAGLCKTIEAPGRQNTLAGASGVSAQVQSAYGDVVAGLRSYQTSISV